jgi:hypothetical protein
MVRWEHGARYIDTIAKFSNVYICLLLKIKALDNRAFGKTSVHCSKSFGTLIIKIVLQIDKVHLCDERRGISLGVGEELNALLG